MNLKTRQALFTQLQGQNPHPETELLYQSPFELLVAVMLSAQATDVGVNKATRKLFAIAHTPKAILALGEPVLLEHLKTLNLYKTKTRHLLGLCQMLLDQHQGEIPRSRKDLEALPGVGRKTANVVLNVVFGEPCIAVDTHIFRVAQRIGLAFGNTPLAIEQGLMKAIPKTFLTHAHHWLVLHGRYVCTARKPQCNTCVIRTWCEYPLKTEPHDPT